MECFFVVALIRSLSPSNTCIVLPGFWDQTHHEDPVCNYKASKKDGSDNIYHPQTVPRSTSRCGKQMRLGPAIEQKKKWHGSEKTKRITSRASFRLAKKVALNVIQQKVARDMRYAWNAEEEKLFSIKEFLTALQVQSFFQDEFQNSFTHNVNQTRKSRWKSMSVQPFSKKGP